MTAPIKMDFANQISIKNPLRPYLILSGKIGKTLGMEDGLQNKLTAVVGAVIQRRPISDICIQLVGERCRKPWISLTTASLCSFV